MQLKRISVSMAAALMLGSLAHAADSYKIDLWLRELSKIITRRAGK